MIQLSFFIQEILDRIIWPAECSSDDEDTSLEEKCRISGFLRQYIENGRFSIDLISLPSVDIKMVWLDQNKCQNIGGGVL